MYIGQEEYFICEYLSHTPVWVVLLQRFLHMCHCYRMDGFFAVKGTHSTCTVRYL